MHIIKNNLENSPYKSNLQGQSFNDGDLGGCNIDGDPGTECPKLWKYLVDKYKLKSVIDIGCGFGYHLRYFIEILKLDGMGVEGSKKVQELSFYPDKILNWDFSKGIPEIDKKFDLGWSTEFVEHVDEQYCNNFIEIFKKCKYLVITHGVPGQAGHHHVNCKSKEYWIDKLLHHGLIYDKDETFLVKEIAKLDYDEYIDWKKNDGKSFRGFASNTNPKDIHEPFVQYNGLFFINTNL